MQGKGPGKVGMGPVWWPQGAELVMLWGFDYQNISELLLMVSCQYGATTVWF